MSEIQDSMPFTQQNPIFISYKRNCAPDEPLAKDLVNFLQKENHKVFIDQTMPVGTRWAEVIEAQLREAQFLIVLLSTSSIGSQMVKGEIMTAQRLYEEQGHPKILPVRVKYNEPFQYPLSAVLDPLNWAFWEKDEDTTNLFDEIAVAISGGTLSIKSNVLKEKIIETSYANLGGQNNLIQPLPDAQPILGSQIPFGFSMGAPEDPQSRYYIMRRSDDVALDTITHSTATINIKGPEQIGKSSLLFKTLNKADEIGKKVAFIDFQLFDSAAFQNADKFYQVFCSQISHELEIENKTDEFWEKYKSEGNVIRSTYYMRDHVLAALNDKTLVLAIDEIESVFDSGFSDEFLLMLRTWHGKRAQGIPRVRAVWQRLNLIFVVTTEPYELIKNEFVSPLNVGTVIDINDSSHEQIAMLNKLHGYPLTDEQANDLMGLLCGHPFLIRRALYLVATKALTVEELFAKATDEYGPFGDHLRYHFFKISAMPELITELCQLINHGRALNREAFRKLRGAGLVKNEFDTVEFRCKLYKEFFKRHLNA